MYCQNVISLDTTRFLTVDEFDRITRVRAKRERCGYVEAALLTAWDYMADLSSTDLSTRELLTKAYKVCMGAIVAKWEADEDKWYQGVKTIMNKFGEWGYRHE